jgi:hypothetical protein
MADQPSRRRRFQFRLRTLMIFTVVVAIWAWGTRYVGSQLRIIRDRHEAAKTYRMIPTLEQSYGPNGALKNETTTSAPWPLRWLGEEGCILIIVPKSTSDPEVARLESLFPEANIRRDSDDE